MTEKELQEILEEEKKKNYQPVLRHDNAMLAKWLMIGKGDRTMAQYAAACGVSPSTFSRVMQSKPKKPLPLELIEKILLNDASDRLTYRELMRANGYLPMAQREKFRDDPSMMATWQEGDRRTNEMIVAKNLLYEKVRRNCMSKDYERLPIGEEGRMLSKFALREDLCYGPRHRLVFKIMEDGMPRWWLLCFREPRGLRDDVERWKKKGVSSDELKEKKERWVKSGAFDFVEEFLRLFLKDAWEPEALQDVKVSIVFTEPEIYRACLEMMKQVKLHSWISLICVDPDPVHDERDGIPEEKREVYRIEETLLEREDGKTVRSIFEDELPLKSPADSEEDEEEIIEIEDTN